jgi:uncharacterized protein
MKLLRKILYIIIIAYFAACMLMYFLQKRMLFPAQYAKPVSVDWKPTAGDSQTQAMIGGRCGKLHVVMWKVNHAKGTLMMFHGNGETLATINNSAHAFLALGYNLMAWDYPGYGRSTDCWFTQNDLLGDSEAAYQWLATQEKPERIYIFGYSIGTGLALSVEAHHQQNPVYLVAAYDALVNVAKDYTFDLLPVKFLMRYPLDTHIWVNQIRQPIYLIHGDQDRLIKPERARMLVKTADGKVKIEWVHGAGHSSHALFLYRNQWLKRLLP